MASAKGKKKNFSFASQHTSLLSSSILLKSEKQLSKMQQHRGLKLKCLQRLIRETRCRLLQNEGQVRSEGRQKLLSPRLLLLTQKSDCSGKSKNAECEIFPKFSMLTTDSNYRLREGPQEEGQSRPLIHGKCSLLSPSQPAPSDP